MGSTEAAARKAEAKKEHDFPTLAAQHGGLQPKRGAKAEYQWRGSATATERRVHYLGRSGRVRHLSLHHGIRLRRRDAYLSQSLLPILRGRITVDHSRQH